MAARSVLTPQLRARVERELTRGASQAVVAQRVGVSARTIRAWLASGRVTRPTRVETDRLLPPGEGVVPAPMSSQALQERLEQAEPGLVAAIIAATQRGSWQAAAWMLERSFPERWARREPSALAVPVDGFAEIDELAVRRRAPVAAQNQPQGENDDG